MWLMAASPVSGDQVESGSPVLDLQSNNGVSLCIHSIQCKRGCLHPDQALAQLPAIFYDTHPPFRRLLLHGINFMLARCIPWLGEMILLWRVAATRQAVSRFQGICVYACMYVYACMCMHVCMCVHKTSK